MSLRFHFVVCGWADCEPDITLAEAIELFYVRDSGKVLLTRAEAEDANAL